MSTTMKGAVHMGQNYNDNLDVHMNTNFEGFQKFITYYPEVGIASKIEWTSLSSTRSALSHDQVTKWMKVRARVYSDSVLC